MVVIFHIIETSASWSTSKEHILQFFSTVWFIGKRYLGNDYILCLKFLSTFTLDDILSSTELNIFRVLD